MKMDIINPADWPQWDDLVLATNGYSFFHSASWAKVLSSSYHYKPTYFTLEEKGKLRALIPIMEVRSLLTGRRGVSLTFSDYCEPLVANREDFPILLAHVIEYARKSGWGYIEFRGGRSFLPHAPVFAGYLGHTTPLSGNDHDLLSRLRDSTRRNIRKAGLAGVETRICTDMQSVGEFYHLHCMTRKRHGVPPQPFSFFRNIHTYVISKNLGFVILASHNGRIIAGAVFFHFGDKALYKYGASDESYQHLRANNLVIWEALKYYSLNGFASFCFGRTDHDDEGLRQFKNGWDTTEKDICYFRYDIEKERFLGNDTGKLTKYARHAGKIPFPMLKAIGQKLYRHMG